MAAGCATFSKRENVGPSKSFAVPNPVKETHFVNYAEALTITVEMITFVRMKRFAAMLKMNGY